MDISNIVGILLFILPGLLSEKIRHILDYPSKEKDSDFLKMVNGVLSSLPTVFLISILSFLINKTTSLREFVNMFDDLLFLVTYILAITLMSILSGFIRVRWRQSTLSLINKLRIKLGRMEDSGGNNWRKFLINNKKERYLEVIIDGCSSKGFAGGYSTPSEADSLILETDDVLYLYEDYDPEKLFTKVLGTYIDIEKNVVIKDYDMTEYNKWVDEKHDKFISQVDGAEA